MNKLTIVVIGTAAAAIASGVMSIVSMVKDHKTQKKIENAVEHIEKLSSDDIQEELIRKAVEKSADKRVDRYMANTEDAILRTARKDLEIQARNAVVNSATEIRESASQEIAKQVALLDIEQLKRRVCDQAEQHMLQKFDRCLDDSARKFQDQLENTRKIYEAVARATSEKENGKNGSADLGVSGIVVF